MKTGGYRIDKNSGAAVPRIFDEMVRLYLDVYAEPPYNSGPLFGEEAFRARTNRQIGNRGFAVSWATSEQEELIGFSFGLPFGIGQWWAGETSSPPAEILHSEKFAVIELVVRKDWRRRGIGKQLLSEVLKDRTEGFAILTADLDAPAHQIYVHWGWEQVGRARHTPEAPSMDQLVLRRPARGY